MNEKLYGLFRRTRWLVLLCVIAAAGPGCMRARAKSLPAGPPLDVPAPPARVVLPLEAEAQPVQQPPPSPEEPRKPPTPPPVAVLAMVRSTLVAVDQGNKTGNYTVLRDLASPSFRDANTPAKLAQIFGTLVQQRIDLLATTVVEPTYTSPPVVTPKNMLYVVGHFAIAPRAINFELLYELNQGRWRLFGVSIQPAS